MIGEKKNIIFLGPPGVGKGTQSKMIASKKSIQHISSGDIFRAELNSNSQLGQKIKDIVNSGAYVPDDLTNEVVINFINKNNLNNKGFILDGYPRTINQAIFLEKSNVQIDFVIYLNANDKIIMDRLKGRRICPKCKTIYHIAKYKDNYCKLDNSKLIIRNDDTLEHIKNRLIIYNRETKPLINYYNERDKLISIDANNEPEIVFQRINELVFNDLD